MKSILDRIPRRDLAFLLLSAVLVVLYLLRANGGFPLDDSWIHQVYGRNLAQYGEWAFIPGIPSAASTSPLYTILLSLGYRLSINFKLWTHTLGLLALWMTGMVGARLAERFLPGQKYVGWLVGAVLIMAWHLIWAAVSGMETMLFSMWALILIGLAWHECDTNHRKSAPESATSTNSLLTANTVRSELYRGAIFGAVAALATLTRPEGIMLIGFIGLCLLIVRPQSSWRAFFAWALTAALVYLVILSPYLVLNWRLTGGLLPNTSAAKQAEYAVLLMSTFLPRVETMLNPLQAGGQLFLLPGMVYFIILALRRIRHSRAALLDFLPLIWAVGLVIIYAARLPAPYQHGRYVMPILPAAILIGMVGTIELVQLGRRSLVGRVLTRSLAIAAVIAFAFFAFIIGPNQYRVDVTIIDEEMVTAAHWIADHIPPDQLLAVHDIGAVGYFAPRPILDLAGLVSPEIIPFITDSDQLWLWLYRRGARYLMAFQNQIPGKDDKDPRLCPVFNTGGKTIIAAGEGNMIVYAFAWNGVCSTS